jgi:hypothetical protein
MKKVYHIFIDWDNPDETLKQIEKLIKENDYNFYNTEIWILK